MCFNFYNSSIIHYRLMTIFFQIKNSRWRSPPYNVAFYLLAKFHEFCRKSYISSIFRIQYSTVAVRIEFSFLLLSSIINIEPVFEIFLRYKRRIRNKNTLLSRISVESMLFPMVLSIRFLKWDQQILNNWNWKFHSKAECFVKK